MIKPPPPPEAPLWATMPVEPIEEFQYAIDNERRAIRLFMRRRWEVAAVVVDLPLAWMQQVMGQQQLADAQLAQQGRLQVTILPPAL